ncbi:acetyl-CoA acetyltransferase [Rubrivivax gelatinosus]|nr:thiolase family protein [Rubrivivax gelatinosus]MBK1616543.1 acetyl-CoA acetyltransferase [Rubrivivax gelatinosus]MBZ8142897.1 acetyl-CoA C-acyltransferase [Rubrivivax gelatinosus]
MSTNTVYIAAAKRTAIGVLLGQFGPVPTVQLGATALRAAVASAKIDPAAIDEVFMGNVLTANVGQAPARQAMMAAGIPLATGATAVNKVCGSGLKAIMLGHDVIRAGSAAVVASGGMESMSNAPHLTYARAGLRMGPTLTVDHLLRDGIDNADGRSLGMFSEACAEKYGFTREQIDAQATESVQRAQRAQCDGSFAAEIVPVTVTSSKGEKLVDTDEGPIRADVARIPLLAPAFKPDGRITPASASGFCDGAAATVLVSEQALKDHGLTPLARIVAHATHSHEPEWFTTAPIGAIDKVLKKAGWTVADVDLFEINEALAVVPMAAMHDLDIPSARLNVNGGACALGHPIGASGARVVVTLIHALKARGLKRGVAALCIGGGEGTAIAIECL